MELNIPSRSLVPLDIIANQATSFRQRVLIKHTILWRGVPEKKTACYVRWTIIITLQGSLPASIAEDKLNSHILVRIDVNVTAYIVFLW